MSADKTSNRRALALAIERKKKSSFVDVVISLVLGLLLGVTFATNIWVILASGLLFVFAGPPLRILEEMKKIRKEG